MCAMRRLRNAPRALSIASGWRSAGAIARACSHSFSLHSYNGYRVKADVIDTGTLDPENFEHLINVLHLCYITQREPHTFIDNGSEVFEGIISLWGMEKKSND
jgi:hypothetical protein